MTKDNQMTSMENELWLRFFRIYPNIIKNIEKGKELYEKLDNEFNANKEEDADELFSISIKLSELAESQKSIMDRLVRLNAQHKLN